jgi:tetratricopeptide (TPR) repeat protein
MRKTDRGYSLAVFFLLLASSPFRPLLAQYREYAVQGYVLDTEKKPLAGAEITILDQNTARRYRVVTDKKGRFSVVGIPHAYYHVTVRKQGYETRLLEWDLTAPQERIQKVEIETVVLASEAQVAEAARSKEAKARLEEAVARLKAGELEAAVAVLKKMTADDPDDSNALYLLGVAFNRLGSFDDATTVLKRVTEIVPDFAGAYHQLALAAQGRNERSAALGYYGQALEKDPRLVESLYNSGLILFQDGRIDEALERFKRALAESPNEAEFLEMAGRCYTNKGDFVTALEYLERARAAYKDPEKGAFLDDLIRKLKEQIK